MAIVLDPPAAAPRRRFALDPPPASSGGRFVLDPPPTSSPAAHPSFPAGQAPRGPMNLLGQADAAVMAAGSRIGRALASLVEPAVPAPVVNPPGVYPRVSVGPQPSWLSQLPATVAEAIPTEAAKFVTPSALLTSAATAGALRGLAGTRLGQFPVETLLPPGRIRDAIARMGAPQIFAPITKPKGPAPRGPVVEAEFTEAPGAPKALPAPGQVGLAPARLVSPESISVETAASKAAASPVNALAIPTSAQIEAGNFQKGHVNLQGLDISIEHPRGSVRSGVSKEGKPWSREVEHHYGYIKRTVSKDGENLDVYIGPNPASQKVFVVDQVKPETGTFDEHKAMLGFDNEAAARAGYLANYPQGWKGLGQITEMPMEQFRAWVNSPASKKPAAEARISTGTARPAPIVPSTPVSPPEGVIAPPGLPQAQGGGVRLIVPSELPQKARLRQLENGLAMIDKQMRTLEQQRSRLVTQGLSTGQIDARLTALGRQFNGLDANVADILVGNTKELSAQLAATQTGTVKLGELSSIEARAQQRITQAADAATRTSAIQTRRTLINELSDQFQLAKPLLRTATKKGLTPQQVGRFAQLQRLQPKPIGAGQSTVPLTQADLQRIQAMTKRIVSRPGQPTGTPPRIPRGQSLVPYYPKGAFRDLNEWQVPQGSGLEPRRAMQLIDRQPNGPTTQKWLALREGELTAGKRWNQLNSALLRLSGHVPEDSPIAKEVTGLLENTLRAVPSPKAVQIAARIRQDNDQLLAQLNQLRARQGKTPILMRGGYMTHISSPDFWAELRAMATGEDVRKVKTLGDLVPQALAPSFRFGRPRQGGPYAIDPIKAFQVYSKAALRVIHLSDSATALKAHAEQLPANAQRYVRRVIKQSVTGWPGGVAENTAKPLRRGITFITSRFAQGTVLGNASSVVMQPWTLPNTMAKLQRPQMAGASLVWMTRGTGWPFAEQWSKTLQGRSVEGLDPGVLTGHKKLTDKLAGAMTGVDRFMVAHNFLSQYLDQVALGKSHGEAVRIADDLTALAQTEFLKTTLAPIFADEVTRAFMTFQTTVNNSFNYVKTDMLKPGQPPAAFWRGAALFAGSIAAMTAVYEALGLPHPGQGRNAAESIMDWIPGMSTFRGGPPSVRIASDFVAGLSSSRPDEQARAWSHFFRALGVVAIGPGSNQLFKSLSGISAVLAGGTYNAKGKQKFPIQGIAEQARSIVGGPYQTKAGRAYIQRGFKPVPMTEAQKTASRARAAFRRRMRP